MANSAVLWLCDQLKGFMMKTIRQFITGIIMVMMANAAQAGAATSENILQLNLKYGTVLIELYPEIAPAHVQRLKELCREHFYDNIKFHRVIAGFMAQTGDPTGTGMHGSSKPNLKAEFNDIKHERGVVSMARASDPNSANSQFFIMLDGSPSLDHQYSAFGRVTSGMEYVDMIKKGAPGSGTVQDPDVIITMRVLSDVEGEGK